jgi:predicted ATPase
LTSDFSLTFESPITFFVGENGSGKSTVLEAIAALYGFHESGGSGDHLNYYSSDETSSKLVDALRPAWQPKVNKGFFFRSESFLI